MEFPHVSDMTKPKILFLHGIGTNSDIFKVQTAAIRHRLGNGFLYDFVEGEHPWPAAPGIDRAFGYRQMCYSYFDGSARSALTAVKDLKDYVEENGPFECVVGFSLGAALAATLLLQPGGHSATRQIRSAVFLSGTLPCDWGELEQSKLRFLLARDTDKVINIPSVHAWSPEDVDYPGQGEQLFEMCEEKNRVQVLHSAGHGVPSQDSEVEAIANAIRDMIAKL